MKLKLIIPIISLIIAGSAAAGWFFFLREPDPENVLKRMMSEMMEVRSEHYELSIGASADLSDFINPINTEFDNVFNLQGINQIRADVVLIGDVATDENRLVTKQASTFDVNVGSTENNQTLLLLQGETRNVNQESYFKFGNITSVLPFDVSGLIGSWYKSDMERVVGDFNDRRRSITGKDNTDQTEKMIKARVRLNEMTEQADLFSNIEILPQEKIGSVAARHYRFKINQKSVRPYINDVVSILLGQSETMVTGDAVKFYNNQLSNATLETWIGKRDSLLYRFKFDWPIEFAPAGSQENNEINVAINVSGTVNLSKFNEEFEVASPDGAKDIQEFNNAMLGLFFGVLLPPGAGLPMNSDRTSPFSLPENSAFDNSQGGTDMVGLGEEDSDNDELSDVAEGFWQTNPNNPDTDGDGYTDGEEVRNGYNPNGAGELF